MSGTLAALLILDEKAALAPDSEYYLALARGERVPRPFCFRPFLPLALGTEFDYWKAVTFGAVVAQGVAIALLTGDLRAILLLMALPGGVRCSIRYPVLVDAAAMAVTLTFALAAGQLHWAVLVVLGIVLTLFRESAAVWYAVYVGSVYPLFGVLATMVGCFIAFGRKAKPGIDNTFIREPVAACLRHRHGNFFSWKLMLLPWGVLLPMALLADWRMAGAIWALSALPLFIVTDTARVQYWAAPALIPLALLAPIPEILWPVLLAVHVFNPYRGA